MAGGHLTAARVRTVTKPGTYFDGDGLRLQVSKAGGKTWLFRYQLKGKTREMGLGSLKTVSLRGARDRVAEARQLLAAGTDPIAHRKATQQKTADSNIWTFAKCADAYIEAKRHEWTNEKHTEQWHTTVKTYCNPVFGDMPVSDIDTALVMQVIEPIWYQKTETASRVRGRIENILSWATVRGHREGINPALWRGHIEHLLPQRNKVQAPRHHPAMPYLDIGAFMAELKHKTSISAKALQFTILTAARSGEVLGANWDEIDKQAGTWTIPGDRMKAKREHRIPLSTQAIALLESLPMQGGWLWPSYQYSKHLSNMSMLKIMRDMGYGVKGTRGAYVPHGFRSSFRDWCGECTNYPREVAEASLAHVLSDKTERAYQRGDYLEKRRRLMQSWADYCNTVQAAGEVVAIRA